MKHLKLFLCFIAVLLICASCGHTEEETEIRKTKAQAEQSTNAAENSSQADNTESDPALEPGSTGEEQEEPEEPTEPAEPDYSKEDLRVLIPEMERTIETYENGASFLLPGTENISVDEDLALYVNDVLMIAAESPEQARKAADQFGASVVGSWEALGFYQLLFDGEKTEEELMAMTEQLEQIGCTACLDYVGIVGEDYIPKDDWGKNQDWNEDQPNGNNWGMEVIHAPTAWDRLDQMKKVRLGLVEGRFIGHDDINTKKVLKNNVMADILVDSKDHGIHVAGIMAAKIDNGGVTGVCAIPGTEVVCSISGNYESVGTYMTRILTLIMDYDCRIINISQLYNSRAQIFAASRGNKKAQNAIKKQAESAEFYLTQALIQEKEFLLCMSAGNVNNIVFYKTATPYNTDAGKILPSYGYTADKLDPLRGKTKYSGDVDARYNHFLNYITEDLFRDRIIVVGSFGQYGYSYKMADSSNIGSRVDIMAPGMRIYSCTENNSYFFKDGTSMAAPHVSGTAGLLLGSNSKLTGAQMKKILCETSDKTLRFPGVSAGMLRADKAVAAVLGENIILYDLMGKTLPQLQSIHWNSLTNEWGEIAAVSGKAHYCFLLASGGTNQESKVAIASVSDESGGASHAAVTAEIKLGMSYKEIKNRFPQIGALESYESIPDMSGKTEKHSIVECQYKGVSLHLNFNGWGDGAILTSAELTQKKN